jgi:hypothetical protein
MPCGITRQKHGMPELTEVQAGIRTAVVDGDTSAVASLLRGGVDPRKRLAIHHRHYVTSLAAALVDRFPATAWLVGSGLVTDAARTFVRTHPPTKPCIAEYGEDFPRFLTRQPDAMRVPYLGQFAALEWHLSRLALAVEGPTMTDLSSIDAQRVADVRLALQPSLHYLRLDWGLDRLISLYLTDSEPRSYVLDVNETWLELRGVRGELRMNRLPRAEFTFRSALLAGETLGDAAIAAIATEPVFAPGPALVALLSEGLVTAIRDTNMSGDEPGEH